MKITKGKFALFLIMTIIFTAFSIFALVYYYSETYSSFFNTAKTEFEIPGLEEGFVFRKEWNMKKSMIYFWLVDIWQTAQLQGFTL